MGRANIRSTCNALAAGLLILSLPMRAPFADGLLLHDHGDDGIHVHKVTPDDIRDDGLCASWHHDHGHTHDGDRHERNEDSDGGAYADPVFIVMSVPAMALGIHCSSGATVASVPHVSSKVLRWSMLPRNSQTSGTLSPALRPSAHPLRPAFALDALLQTSHALLL